MRYRKSGKQECYEFAIKLAESLPFSQLWVSTGPLFHITSDCMHFLAQHPALTDDDIEDACFAAVRTVRGYRKSRNC